MSDQLLRAALHALDAGHIKIAKSLIELHDAILEQAVHQWKEPRPF